MRAAPLELVGAAAGREAALGRDPSGTTDTIDLIEREARDLGFDPVRRGRAGRPELVLRTVRSPTSRPTTPTASAHCTSGSPRASPGCTATSRCSAWSCEIRTGPAVACRCAGSTRRRPRSTPPTGRTRHDLDHVRTLRRCPPTIHGESVALPAEHGGWGLTAEPVLLGLLIAPSWAGLVLGAAAMTAFVARTPIKIGLGDLRRGRRLDRTRVALAIGAAELVLLGVLAATAVLLADQPFWIPLLVAAPLLVTELAYDIRSRGRRLVPELAGSIGVASVAAMIVLADGHDLVPPSASGRCWPPER